MTGAESLSGYRPSVLARDKLADALAPICDEL